MHFHRYSVTVPVTIKIPEVTLNLSKDVQVIQVNDRVKIPGEDKKSDVNGYLEQQSRREISRLRDNLVRRINYKYSIDLPAKR